MVMDADNAGDVKAACGIRKTTANVAINSRIAGDLCKKKIRNFGERK